jgi:transcriptional repressor NrdR
MKCIFCGSETHVTDKRESPEGTRRRRECLKCKKRFTTYEKADEINLHVVKKDGRREPYSREKIKAGILKACEKRPVSIDKVEKIINDIEEKLRNPKNSRNFGATKYKEGKKHFVGKGKEVKTEVIGKMVMDKLKKLDKVAYIRFASVYMNFKDVKDFKEVVKEVKE